MEVSDLALNDHGQALIREETLSPMTSVHIHASCQRVTIPIFFSIPRNLGGTIFSKSMAALSIGFALPVETGRLYYTRESKTPRLRTT